MNNTRICITMGHLYLCQVSTLEFSFTDARERIHVISVLPQPPAQTMKRSVTTNNSLSFGGQ